MTEPLDPPRWSEAATDAPPELSALLQEAQRDLPSSNELDAMFARLSPKLSPLAPVSAQRVPWSRIGRILGVLGLAGAGALIVRGVASPGAAPPERPASTVISPQPPTPATTPSAEPEPTAAPTVVEATPKVPSAPGKPRTAAKLGEAELLEAARRALATDPARSLRLTEQHKARFPSGILKQEREVIAIEALRKLGRANAASTRANQFENEFPDSAHRRGVESGRGKP